MQFTGKQCGKHCCDTTLTSNKGFRCGFKIFLYFSSTICAILVEGIMRNLGVKLF